MNHTVIARTGRRLAAVGCAAAVAFGVMAITPDVSADEPKLTIKPKPEALESVSPELTKPGVRREQEPGVRLEQKPGVRLEQQPGVRGEPGMRRDPRAAVKGLILECKPWKPPPDYRLRPCFKNTTQKSWYGKTIVWMADNGESGEVKEPWFHASGGIVCGPEMHWLKQLNFTKCSAWLK